MPKEPHEKDFHHQVWLMESSSGMQNWNLAKAMANVFKCVWDAIKSVKDDTKATRALLAAPFAPPFSKLARKNFGKRAQPVMRVVRGQRVGRF
jgi:hypothetical protein